MLVISRLQHNTEITSVDVGAFVGSFVMHARHVAAQARDDAGHVHELTGLIHQFDHELAVAPRHQKSAADHAGENGHVDVAARKQTNGLLALHVHLAEHGGSHCHRAGALSDQLVLLHQGKDRRGDLVITVLVETPKNLNSEQKKLLRQFADSLGEKNSARKKGVFERFFK